MSTAYAHTAACVGRILDIVGDCSNGEQKLTLSGLFPHLPILDLRELVAQSTFERLAANTRSRLAAAIRTQLGTLRDQSLQQYRQMAQQHYSLDRCGLPDIEIEKQLARIFEFRYRKCLDDIRIMLAEALNQSDCVGDSRNARGGFGDVSTPCHLPKPD